MRINREMDTLAARAKRARQHAKLTQVEASNASGVKQSDISKIERGETQRSVGLLALARAYGVNPNWLDTGDGEMIGSEKAPTVIDLEDNPDYPAIRRVTFKLSAGACGFGIQYRDERGAPIVFQRQWYEGRGLHPDKIFAVEVSNGSMEPGLYDGDTVVVNTESVDPKDGVVFAVNYGGELVIKRLVRDGGQWWLSSDNPDQRKYSRKVCNEHCILIGDDRAQAERTNLTRGERDETFLIALAIAPLAVAAQCCSRRVTRCQMLRSGLSVSRPPPHRLPEQAGSRQPQTMR